MRTAEEIEQIERELSAPRWRGAWLTVRCLTDAAAHRRLLPSPLEPAGEPLIAVTVGRWQSSCLGGFAGGTLSLDARLGELTGSYVLAQFMDAEPPIVFGRELFGEPKKLATAGLERHPDRVHAWVDRHGERLIELDADLQADLGPADGSRHSFNVKARTAANGHGLEEDAILTHTWFDTALHVRRPGAGTVVLGHTVHDPLDEVPVEEVREVLYAEDEVTAHCRAIATIPAQAFLPHHYGRQDDWLALAAGAKGAS